MNTKQSTNYQSIRRGIPYRSRLPTVIKRKYPIKPPPPRPLPPPPPSFNFRVLLIGNNYCGTSSELAGCVTDIATAKAFFTANVKTPYKLQFFELSDSRSLTDRNKIVYGSQGSGTRANILKGIQWLLAGVKSGDVLYLHYSGHGSAQRTTDLGEADQIDSTWVPIDYKKAGVIVDNDLRKLLVNNVPVGVTLWVTSDSCHSGTVLDLRFGYLDVSFKRIHGDEVDNHERAVVTSTSMSEDTYYSVTKGNIFLISGCKDLQTSADTYEDGKNQGALTWALFTVLNTNKTAPLKYVIRDVRAMLLLNRYNQQPQLSSGQACNLDASFSSIVKC